MKLVLPEKSKWLDDVAGRSTIVGPNASVTICRLLMDDQATPKASMFSSARSLPFKNKHKKPSTPAMMRSNCYTIRPESSQDTPPAPTNA